MIPARSSSPCSLESGRSIVVVQPGAVSDYRVGDRVRVTNDGSQTRVAR
ncbi:hypothetical protein H1235_02060 [Pseudoxanthomonas sp. NC8]|nr:hypothetical protein H1235_02060 [Pseudoxanthomonas sp. NC8]